jgi:hypothetical protein
MNDVMRLDGDLPRVANADKMAYRSRSVTFNYVENIVGLRNLHVIITSPTGGKYMCMPTGEIRLWLVASAEQKNVNKYASFDNQTHLHRAYQSINQSIKLQCIY